MSHDIEKWHVPEIGTAGQRQAMCLSPGLPAPGTTILMREIHRTGQFGSLTYADMPFVLAPNLWARLSSKGSKPGTKAERAHGDGIEVDTQSPEALDEVYWRTFDGKTYIGADGLRKPACAGYGPDRRLPRSDPADAAQDRKTTLCFQEQQQYPADWRHWPRPCRTPIFWCRCASRLTMRPAS
jgi:hypothetical protein